MSPAFRHLPEASSMMPRLALAGLALVAAAGCGSWKRVGTTDQRAPTEQLTQLLDASTFYQRLGRLAAPEPLPFVGTVAFAAAPADSVVAILGLSLENRALSFQREGNTFVARYRVSISFQREGEPPIDLARDELVRVATFQETMRDDESVLFQQAIRLMPDSYHVVVAVRDPVSTSESRAEAGFVAPNFRPGTTSPPILAYQAAGRSDLDDPVAVVLNSRGTVAYGGDTLLVYVEGYRFAGATAVPFEVRDGNDSLLVGDSLRFRGGREVETQVVRLAPDSIALGELKLVVGTEPAEYTASALVSLSEAWVVTNFDEVVGLLRYFGEDNRLSQLRDAPEAARPRLWREFWRETDPNPITPENEALTAYFSRVAGANQQFRDEGVPGWRTDRGEVFITLGSPDEVYDASPTSQGRIIRWTYLQERLTLYFHDETGFGRFRLTPSSRAEYERVLSRVRRQAE